MAADAVYSLLSQLGGTLLSSQLPPGSGDKYYVHDQATPASVWTIDHNLGKYPSPTFVDTAGTWWIAEVTFPSVNRVVARFYANGSPVAFSGKAFLS